MKSKLYIDFRRFCAKKGFDTILISTLTDYIGDSYVIDEYSSRPGLMSREKFYALLDEFCEDAEYTTQFAMSEDRVDKLSMAWIFTPNIHLKWDKEVLGCPC